MLGTALRFDNRFVRELPGDADETLRPRQVTGALYSRVRPTAVRAPRLLAWSPEVAALLGLSREMVLEPLFADVFGGNALLDGMAPYAANYGGHQFGQWAGQLGDGRALTLGETINARGERWELQLKGAGLTPYSRHADGRAVLRSSIREFLCSEAMHHLGVPTTRALSLVGTGESVIRDMFYDGHPRPEPGAVVCRVAPSFIRFGNFELPTSRGDIALLDQLIDFTIRRDFPELDAHGSASGPPREGGTAALDAAARRSPPHGGAATAEDTRIAWFREVCRRTAVMVAHWMRVGFVHGVMNTDNMSILGLTIDYGPYGWIDNLDLAWTPNTTDAGMRRYRFGQQPQIAYWNLNRLAEAIAPGFTAVEPLQASLDYFIEVFTAETHGHVAAKLGLRDCGEEGIALMESLYALMQNGEIDMTIFFRRLADVGIDSPSPEPLRQAYYDEEKMRPHEPALQQWLERWATRVREDAMPVEERRQRMNGANPKYVLRNYLAQQAIDRAEQGDTGGIDELLDLLRHPYDEQPGREHFFARRPDWARQKAGCSMLSCSS